MCGISIFRKKNRSKINSIKHRGIQYTEIEENGWIYGHHRLPIQTLEEDNWTQPTRVDDGFFLFNGEIFNYQDFGDYENDVDYLKSFFNSRKSDINTYAEEMNKWDGFWSIVFVDKKDDVIIVFTDPLGKKQLYYNRKGEISSEIRDLSIDKILDKTYISIINKWGYNSDDKTIYADVKRFMPNKFYVYPDKNKHSPFMLAADYFKWDENIPNKDFYSLLEESVKRRLISKKYKISTLFSGGLDSTIILYFLRKLKADINIYSINNGTDGESIKYMEKEWDLKINYLSIDASNLSLEEKMKIYDINDGPIDLGSVIPQYYLFKEIKDKIVLTGDGADEILGGYRRISEYDSQKSDVFQELPFYHLIRLDRMSMNFTIEQRSPFLGHDVIRKALSLPYPERTHKRALKEEFRGYIPDKIIDRKKEPLKIGSIRKNEAKYRGQIIQQYLEYLKLSGKITI